MVVEVGIFPLICGWWIDICSLVRVLGSYSFERQLYIIFKNMLSVYGTFKLKRQHKGAVIKNETEGGGRDFKILYKIM